MVIMRHTSQRLLGLFLSILLLLLLFPTVRAEEPAAQRQGSLTVRLEHSYTSDGQTRGIPNVEIRLYLVADMDDNGRMTASEAFQSFAGSLEGVMTQENWEKLIPELTQTVEANAIPVTVQQRSDAAGSVRLEGLSPGLYLACFGNGTHPDRPAITVGFQSTLVALPYRGEGNAQMQDLENHDQWDYDYTILPKSFEAQVIDRIQKLWKDNQDAKKLRPKELNVELEYADGTVQKLVLNAENGWILEFTPASASAVVALREPTLPKGYVYRGFSCVGATVQFTNELTPDSESPTPINPSPDPKPGLPYTGQLWWPVPVLLVSGAVLILLGLLQRKRKSNGKA